MTLEHHYSIFVCTLLLLIFFECQSQNSFTLGWKGGSGASLFPVEPVFKSNNIQRNVQANPQIHTGVLIAYEIADKAGIESGCQLIHHTYSYREKRSYVKNWFNQPTAIDVADLQIPVLLTYNLHHRYNASRYFKIAAGTSLDWFFSDLLLRGAPRSVKNLIVGIRTAKILEYGKMEFAIEHQYSMNRYTVKGDNYNQLNDIINTRTSFLNFSVMYFLPSKAKYPTL